MNNKQQIAAMKSVRKTWEFNPVRVVPSKKGYVRKNRNNQKWD